jgi:predicted ATPase
MHVWLNTVISRVIFRSLAAIGASIHPGAWWRNECTRITDDEAVLPTSAGVTSNQPLVRHYLARLLVGRSKPGLGSVVA